MGETLRRSPLKKLFLLSAFLWGVVLQDGIAQSVLSPGDIAVVTVNSDSPDSFDFVPLVDLESSTEIYFTDNPYVASGDSLRDDGEGVLKYTAESPIPAGSVISYEGSESNGFVQTDGSYNANASGDNLIAYQVAPDTTYLLGVGWARGGTVWEYFDSPMNERSDIPPSLSKDDNTILSLGTDQNLQYDSNNGLNGTAESLLALIGDETNWVGNDENAYDAFGSSFRVIDPPTIAFSTSTSSVNEDESSIELTVELVEASGTAVDVDISFLENASSSTAADIDGFSSQTVSFTDSDKSGATKTITISLNNDEEFEGTERAVFQLKNNTDGSIVEPDILTLSITDDNIPDVVINEFLADPPDDTLGDANGDGTRDGYDDEFVELVNNESTDIDISGWKLSDDQGSHIRHTFPSGTVIPAGRALVVFGGGNPKGNFGGALVQTSSSLNLANAGGNVTLLDSQNNIIQDIAYESEAEDDQSITRSPDISGTLDTKHSEASGADGALFSPGTKIDGTPFGSRHAIAFRGTEGWRMVTSPVADATFNDLFGNMWMQGIAGSDYDGAGFKNIITWDETDSTFTTPANMSMSDKLVPGKGYVVYVFEDDDARKAGIQGGFPKIIDLEGSENSTSVNVTVSATDNDNSGSIEEAKNEGYNLLGNPFDTDIVASQVIAALESKGNLNSNVYVWDHSAGNGNGQYVALSGNETIAPFQAFFVHFTTAFSSTQVSFNKSSLEANEGTRFYKDNSEEPLTFDLQLHGETYFDTYSVEFSEKGKTDLDPHDAYKLFSLNPQSINLFSTLNQHRLQKNVLPKELKSRLDIPLSFDAPERTSLTFKWDRELENIPAGWELKLIDNEQKREINLRDSEQYSFTASTSQEENTSNQLSEQDRYLNKADRDEYDSRFTLSIEPKAKDNIASKDLPESVKLKPNYPNPFNPQTTIPFELSQDSEVKLTIWNMIGQKVATLVDGLVEAGTHEETWNASSMPSGIYIARFEVSGTVFTRKMTLIK